MTNIHVWTPRRYKFEGFQEFLLERPFFSNGKVSTVQIHYRHQLTHAHLYDIFTKALVGRNTKSINIFVFDDDELEDGCGLETLEMSIKHLINITKIHPRTYFLFADFIDFLYTDATYSNRQLIALKQDIIGHTCQFPSRNFYKDFHGLIDGADCDCFNCPTEEGMNKLFEVFATLLQTRSPVGAF
jgi:hypothetical protein